MAQNNLLDTYTILSNEHSYYFRKTKDEATKGNPLAIMTQS